MKYRRLGNTGLEVSEIGFGAWGIGGTHNGAVSYGPTDDRTSVAALRRAFELGITFYDTSDLYGFGHSERLLGEAFADVRGQVVIASKVGFLDPAAQNFTPAHIRKSIEGTLARLKTEYLDLYQLHNPPHGVMADRGDAVETLRRLRKEGKVRAIGISVKSPDEGLLAAAVPDVGVVQVNFNLTDQRALENGLFAHCRGAGIGVICRTPLCFGFLTGQYAGDHRFHPSDHRNAWSPEQIEKWACAWTVFTAEAGAPSTRAQMALRFCLSYDAISTVIPGMLKSEEVEENAAASDLGPLGPEEREQMEHAYREHTFFVSNRR